MKLQSIRETAQRYGVDKAVGYALAARVWQLLTGQITALLIVFCLSDIEQGYYYAFLYLLAMQVFVELGLHVVLINVASHEWSHFKITDEGIQGNPDALSRMSSLCRTASRWYGIAAALFIGGVSAAGYFYFSGDSPASPEPAELIEVKWWGPWFTLVILTGLQLSLLPRTSVLEGCGQLSVINMVRFRQNVAGSIVVWTMMYCGAGVWALCGSAAVRLIGETWLAVIRYRPFFASLESGQSGASIDWKQEVLPLQWRIAVQGVLHWFATHLTGLVLFRTHGEVVGGRFGLMWTVFTAIQSGSLAWVETRRPLFGRLIATQNYEKLDREFFRLSRISITLLSVGATLFCVGVYVVNAFPNDIFSRIASRLPDLWSTAIFGTAFIAYHPALCTNLYVRAHKRDPFLVPATLSSLTIASLVYWLGIRYGIRGSGIGYLLGVSAVQTPLWVTIWYVTRRSWHMEERDR